MVKFTFGLPTYRDFDGVYFTVSALQIYHKKYFEENELVVVDNAPKTPEGLEVSRFLEHVRSGHPKNAVVYYPFTNNIGTGTSKHKIFELATGKYVVVMDSHVLLHPGAIESVEGYFDEFPESKDILSGPLMLDDNKNFSTHYIPKWRGQMFGIWGSNPAAADPNAPPFEIPATGTGCFACRKDAWPGINPLFKGFGPEEIYIHEKIRRNGGKAICIPGFRWSHRFGRPKGVTYPLYLWHKVRNYILAYKELGWDIEEIKRYFVGGGFMTEKDWNVLISNPEGLVDPPLFFDIADDAQPELNKIKQYVNKEPNKREDVMFVPPEYRHLSPEALKKLQEEIQNRAFNEQQDKQIPQQPPQAIRQPPQQAQQVSQNSGGCSDCGQKQIVPRENILKQMVSYKTLSELYISDLENHLEEARKELEKIVPNCKHIVEIGDDPFGSTLAVLRNMSKEAVFITYYQDPKYIPELRYLGELSRKENKSLHFTVGPGNQLTIYKNVDLVIIDSMIHDAEFIYNTLSSLLPKCDHYCLLLNTKKYGIMTAENKPGIMPAVTRYLKENPKWSVIEHFIEGNGYTLLSCKSEDKPKLPSKIKVAANLVTAAKQHIVAGAEHVTPEELERRLSICSICKYRVGERCSVCGCYLINGIGGMGKALWKEQPCPLGFWNQTSE